MSKHFQWRLASTDLPDKPIAQHIQAIHNLYRIDGLKPVKWARERLPQLCACDWPKQEVLTASQMLWIYRAVGQIDMDWRDVPGCGHARVIALAQSDLVGEVYPLVQGGQYWAIAITEPEGGSDPLSMSTCATLEGDDYILNGEKIFVGRVQEAAKILLFARSARSYGLTLFAIDASAQGIDLETLRGNGLLQTSWSRLTLRNVRVPASYRVGLEGQGMSLLHRHFAYWRTMMSAAVIGAAESLLVEVANFARTRQIVTGALHEAPHFQIEFAHVVGRIRGAWALIQQAAASTILRECETEAGCLAKADAVSAALECVDLWRRFMGARAYLADTPGTRQSSAIEAFRSADGATDALYAAVGKRLLEI